MQIDQHSKLQALIWSKGERDYITFVAAVVSWPLAIGAVLPELNTEKANIGAAGTIGQAIEHDS